MTKKRGKAGKPKQTGERYANGRLKPQAIGRTPEQALKAASLVRGGDPALSTSPVRVLYARGVIDEVQRHAAERYHADYRIAYGKGQARISSYGAQTGEIDLDAVQAARVRIAKDVERMAALSRKYKDIFDNLVVFERFPSWMDPSQYQQDQFARESFRLDMERRSQHLSVSDATKDCETPEDCALVRSAVEQANARTDAEYHNRIEALRLRLLPPAFSADTIPELAIFLSVLRCIMGNAQQTPIIRAPVVPAWRHDPPDATGVSIAHSAAIYAPPGEIDRLYEGRRA